MPENLNFRDALDPRCLNQFVRQRFNKIAHEKRFVPNPDHIHKPGVPESRARVVSLHLYGRAMNSFHVYDVDAGTRRLIDVPHNES